MKIRLASAQVAGAQKELLRALENEVHIGARSIPPSDLLAQPPQGNAEGSLPSAQPGSAGVRHHSWKCIQSVELTGSAEALHPPGPAG